MDRFELGQELGNLLEDNLIISDEIEVELMKEIEIKSLIKDLNSQFSSSSSSLIVSAEIFNIFKSLIKNVNLLNNDLVKMLGNCLFNGLEMEITSTSESIADNSQENFETHMYTLSHFIFLWYWFFDSMENMPKEKKKSGVWLAAPKSPKDVGLRGTAMKVIQQFVSLNLDALFLSSAERDLVVNDVIFKCLRLSMEDGDVLKNAVIKASILDVFTRCATKYQSSFKVLSNYMQDFLREESICEFVADILDVCTVTYQYSASVEFMLKTVGEKQYTDKDQDKLSKATSKFLLKFAELQPKEVMKQMVHLNDLLDSESATIRAVMMDVITTIIQTYLCNPAVNIADATTTSTNLQSFYSILAQRLQDTSALVRSRVLRLLIKLTQRNPSSPATSCIPLTLRPSLVHASILRLRDKSSIVRKKAVELVSAFLETHPFIGVAADLGAVSEKRFQARVDGLESEIKEKIQSLTPPPKEGEEHEEEEEEIELSPEIQQQVAQMQALLKYYQDALAFAKMMNSACGVVCDLLESSLKTEVVGALKFFVVAHRYEVEGAYAGVCNMVHKIWDKGTDEEGSNSIRDVLLQSFYDVHLNPPTSTPAPPPEQTSLQIAHNLTDLVESMNLAQQTSLEEVISTMASQNRLPDHLPASLWSLVTTKSAAVTSERKKNAMMVIGMIGKSEKSVIAERLDVLTRFGLGSLVKENDFGIAKYSCIALLQLYHVKRQKGVYKASLERKSSDHPTCLRIVDLLLQQTVPSFEWFSFAEQALNALYLMTEQPDGVCGAIIKKMSERVFGEAHIEEEVDNVTKDMGNVALDSERDVEMETGEEEEKTVGEEENHAPSAKPSTAFLLAQLLFVVGHVAIKQIVHLESIESEWKRRKMQKEAGESKKAANSATDELEMVTGSAEDEFAETIAMVRERELLFGPNSLLSLYGPLIVHVLTHNQKFKDPMLQLMAGLALCKFMCISSDFCEAHLHLLFAVMERSTDPIMRSNLIIGLGDLAICFNSIIDEHIGNLYARLQDTEFFVRKNTLMVLTFLILNGMIKVKGQISEMAKCVEDKDERIRNLSKAFFRELSTKDNAIYNNLPDIISNLSVVGEEEYKSIVKFLFKFIVKERQSESIVEKLCMRFKHAETERQWRDIGFCLSLLSFGTEKSLKKLGDHFSLFQDKLYEPALFKYLSDIVTKAGKGKNELKSAADDFKERLVAGQAKAVEDHEAALEAHNGGKGVSFKEWKDVVGASDTPRLSLPMPPPAAGDDTVDETEEQAQQEDTAEEQTHQLEQDQDDNNKKAVEKQKSEERDSDDTITDTEVEIPLPVKKTPRKPAPKSKKATAKRVPTRRTGRRAVVDSSEDDD